MNDPEEVRDKLEQIKQLWSELERTAEDSREYEVLIEKIHTLATEYRKLTVATGKRERSTKSV